MTTVFAFSSENWNRPQIEIDTLMNLFAINAARLQQEALAKNIQVRILSTGSNHLFSLFDVNTLSPDTSKLPPHVLTALQQLQSSTQHCSGFVANICVSYGARADLCSGIQRLAQRLLAGGLSLQALDEQTVSDSLATCGCPGDSVIIYKEYGDSSKLVVPLLHFISYLTPLTVSAASSISNSLASELVSFSNH